MKMCPKCKIDKETVEFYKNKAASDGLQAWCKICLNLHFSKNKESKSLYDKARVDKMGRELVNSKNKEWRQTHKNSVYRYNLRYQSIRNRRLRLATPKCLSKTDKKLIVDFYEKRPEGFHVDHIIPIKGKLVSGLHVPWNLQYLPAVENLKKGNR